MRQLNSMVSELGDREGVLRVMLRKTATNAEPLAKVMIEYSGGSAKLDKQQRSVLAKSYRSWRRGQGNTRDRRKRGEKSPGKLASYLGQLHGGSSPRSSPQDSILYPAAVVPQGTRCRHGRSMARHGGADVASLMRSRRWKSLCDS